jgi:hypothetical protein
LIGQLWHEGRIVLDTNPDVKAPVVQGVYPARAAFGRQAGAKGRGGQTGQGGRGGRAPQAVIPRAGAALPAGAAAERPADGAAAGDKRRRRRRRRSPDSVAGTQSA